MLWRVLLCPKIYPTYTLKINRYLDKYLFLASGRLHILIGYISIISIIIQL